MPPPSADGSLVAPLIARLKEHRLGGVDLVTCSALATCAGFYLVWGGWWLGWFLFLAVALPLVFAFRCDALRAARIDRFLWAAGLFVLYMLGSSFFTGYSEGYTAGDVGYSLVDLALMAAFVFGLWRVVDEGQASRMLRWMVASAAVAALVSIPIFYGLIQGDLFLGRLRNVFVYGGQHPVPTGITFGFAALGGSALYRCGLAPADRRWLLAALAVLFFAVFLTQSRGGLLALSVGFAGLALAKRRRDALPPILLFLAIGVAFQWGMPRLRDVLSEPEPPPGPAALANPAPMPPPGEGVAPPPNIAPPAQPVPEKAPPPEPAAGADAKPPDPPKSVIADSEPVDRRKELPKNPLGDFMQRKDGGRFLLWRILSKRLDSPADHVFGLGAWARDVPLEHELYWTPGHPHGAFFSTYLHGGAVGCVLLAGMIGIGAWRAAWLAFRGGDPRWLPLVAFGCAAFIADGDRFDQFNTTPRMEQLCFWLPLVCASATYTLRRGKPARHD
ncbi:MAG: hypothetical protein R3F11_32480 [Verrucomicrobiales bacterium]